MKNTFEEHGWIPTESTFSATELGTISGMPLNLQRVWRSRGQLPGGSGKQARFTSHQVAEIMVRYHLALNGIPPGESAPIGKEVAQQILCFALLGSGGACEVVGQIGEVENFLELFKRDILAGDISVAQELAGSVELSQFLWREDGGDLGLVADVVQLITARRSISGLFVDLEVAADQLVERAGRPLFSINVSPRASGRRIRRMTNGRMLELVSG